MDHIAKGAERQASDAESAIWAALRLDDLDDLRTSGLTGAGLVVLGTGRTDNACSMCSNSLTTAGCGGC